MATMHRARGILDVDRHKTVSVTGRAKTMTQGIGAHKALFSAPDPPLSVIVDQVAVVDTAEVLATTRAKGTARARNVQLGILVGMMEAELLYVQGVADTSPTPQQAAATIEAAGLVVARIGQHVKPVLGIKQGPTLGSVLMEANATILTGGSQKGKFFNWQYTSDNGKTWITLPSTPKASTSLGNLTPLNTYGFRVSVTNSDAIAGEWSQTVSFLVH
jgi:hypothetical protein